MPPGADSALELDDTEWQENESYAEEDTEDGQGWPMAMIAVAILALILLGVGGYGVVKQRAATQEERRQLQATLATAVEPGKAAGNPQKCLLQQVLCDRAVPDKSFEVAANRRGQRFGRFVKGRRFEGSICHARLLGCPARLPIRSDPSPRV